MSGAGGDTSWFDDPVALEREVRAAYAGVGAPPRIPGYEGLIEVARGGQAAVFRAIQRSTGRVVAVKVLYERAGGGLADRRRFEREVSVVASLRHPGVVSVYDSGVTDGGRPYLVMEFVDGPPLDRHVAGALGGGVAGCAPVRETVELFVRVCEAVQHAHRRGVIHRDLKPSNIRVDGDGRPRVLDFGLARESADASLTVSAGGHFLGSLPWASPEQVDGRVGEVDVRSDVYSLGVVLYQLLTGRFPYEVESGMRRAMESIVSAAPERPESVRAEIDGEISAIVLTCLAKEQERRYESAGDLARDLRRYLSGEPIEAKRETAWYAVRTRLARYRAVAAVAAAMTVLLGIGALAANAYRLDAVRQRDAAREAMLEASSINEFMEEVFSSVDPFLDADRDVTLVEVLGLASERVGERFVDTPKVRAAVHSLLATTYWSLGDLRQAAEHYRPALELRRSLLGLDARETLDVQNNLGAVLMDLEAFDEAASLLEDGLTRAGRAFGPDDPLTVVMRHNRAYLHHYVGDLASAERLYRETLEGMRRVHGRSHAETLTTMNALASVLLDLGRVEEARSMVREVWEGRRAALGPDHPQTVLALQNLASVEQRRGRTREAEAIVREASEAMSRVLGPSHPWTLGTRANHAAMLAALGRGEEAERLCLATIPESLGALGEHHEITHRLMNALGQALLDQGRLVEAEGVMRAVVRESERVVGRDDPRTLALRNTLASVLREAGLADEAESMVRSVVEAWTALRGEGHTETLIAMGNLAACVRELGRAEEAASLYGRALDLGASGVPAGHWLMASLRSGLGRALSDAGRHAEAEAHLLEGYRALAEALGATHSLSCEAAGGLAVVYEALGRVEEAARFEARAGAEE